MNPQIAQKILEFLDRVEITGREAALLLHCRDAVIQAAQPQESIKDEQQEESK